MAFVNQEESDGEDDGLPSGPHRKACKKVKEVKKVFAYHFENNWQLGIVHDRINEMRDRIKDIQDRAREVTSGADSDEIKGEVDEIGLKIAEFLEEMKVMTEWRESVISKNKRIQKDMSKVLRKVETLVYEDLDKIGTLEDESIIQIFNDDSEIMTEINQRLADLKSRTQEIRRNITKNGVRLEDIDFKTLQYRKRIKQIQGAEEDDGDKRRCCIT